MIGYTKLLCRTATVSDVIKSNQQGHDLPPHLLQFSSINRPLVVWNMTNRCNLRCKHCYISAEDHKYEDELSTEEAREFIRDLAAIKIPVLLFSGGEPLLRKDIFELAEYASGLGLRVVLSTNGTLINDEIAVKIKTAGFQYVGVSIDGGPVTHDKFRNKEGSFAAAINGIRTCMRHGIKTGIRFTVNKENQADLPEVLALVEAEGIPRFCMYHLVYSGRGEEISEIDTSAAEKKEILNLVKEKTLELHKKGVEVEILTTDNHADGISLYQYIKQNEPHRADEIIKLLEMHGGCSAGTKFANIDPRGNVHPCQFWQDYTIGNVREVPFSQIWNSDDQLLVQLREKEKHVKGKCARCNFKALCSGCRIRARAVYGDIWAEDPACYLSEEEIKG